MEYEIPREIFKQRLEDRLNFVCVDLLPADRTPVKFESVDHLNYSSQFKKKFSAKAANDLSDLGCHFVYYYNGTADDVVLNKGLG